MAALIFINEEALTKVMLVQAIDTIDLKVMKIEGLSPQTKREVTASLLPIHS